MSDENVNEIRSHYRAAANGDVGSLRWLDERIGMEFRWTPQIPGAPAPEPIDEPRWRPERFIDLHERVLVRVRLTGRGRETGSETETRLAHLWTVQRGRAVSLTVYHDWESGLSAAGVAE